MVNDKWLIDSERRGRFEDIAKYPVQDIFLGVTVGMYGYKQLEIDILLKNCKGKEKHFVTVSSLDKGILEQ